jgi:aromatic ring-opening dioxygenase LigB subunit
VEERRSALERGIIAGCICPHPPLIVPSIGGREIGRVESTVSAMRRLAEELRLMAPDVMVFISPHTPMLPDRFTVKQSSPLRGDFAAFGHPEETLERECDLELSEAIVAEGKARGIDIIALPERARSGPMWMGAGAREKLDHGVLVPLYYLGKGVSAKIVSLSISMLSYRAHQLLGKVVRLACEKLGREALFIASGDLSHRLLPGAPAGYSPRGEEFDLAVCRIAEKGAFELLDELDDELVEEAGECGLRSIHALRGALEDYAIENSLLSYEGPYGVGYLVSLHRVTGARA